MTVQVLRVGDTLYGFCNGYFGRDSYADKQVEAIGSDWVVAREVGSGSLVMYLGRPEDLLKYTVEESGEVP